MQHYPMLQRKLLYTGGTCGKRPVTQVWQPRRWRSRCAAGRSRSDGAPVAAYGVVGGARPPSSRCWQTPSRH